MKTANKLTPLQIKFCTDNISGFADDTVVELAGSAASGRKFWRIKPKDRSSVILVVWSSDDSEWNNFLSVAKEVTGNFFPEIYSYSHKDGLILEEDLGKNTLKNSLKSAIHEEDKKSLYKSVIEKLVEWQDMDITDMPVLSSRVLDRDTFIWESNYFARYLVTQYFGLDIILDQSWQNERYVLASKLASNPLAPLHRDFQSENIIVMRNGDVKFVDFQGARVGPLEYDLASLLFDPYVTVGADLRMELFDYYCLSGHATSYKMLCLAGAQRLMQALGAYANLSLNKGKERYEKFIPLALATLWEITCNVEELKVLNFIVDRCRVELQ